jgi:hypothetical protein
MNAHETRREHNDTGVILSLHWEGRAKLEHHVNWYPIWDSNGFV